MNVKDVKLALEKKFNEPLKNGACRHIVFWYDGGGDFREQLSEIIPESVKLLEIDNNYFSVKYTLEEEEPETDFLVYRTEQRPDVGEDWLYDIYSYSSEFSADTVALIMNELKVDGAHIRGFLKENKDFFNSRERFEKLSELVNPQWTIEDFKMGMLTVICRNKHFSLEEIVKTLLMESLDEAENKYWKLIEKWPGKNSFYALVNKTYGYDHAQPSLKGLFISLLLTTLSATSEVEVPSTWKTYISRYKNNCLIFLDHWMNHAGDSDVFNQLSDAIAQEINIKNILSNVPVERFAGCDVFSIIDQCIILHISNCIVEGLEEYEEYMNLIGKRKSTHWFDRYNNIYHGLEAILKMKIFERRYRNGFPVTDPGTMIQEYAGEYVQFDFLYREFCYQLDQVDNDIFKNLDTFIESLYKNWYLQNLGDAWSKAVNNDIEKVWKSRSIDRQQDFYERNVKPLLDKNRKVFVIISDALRYEAGRELEMLLNRDTRGSTNVTPLLGVLPSYTALGMAALLPHDRITINDKGTVYVDGVNTSFLGGREKILQKHSPEAQAMYLKDLMKESRDDARDKIKDATVVYLYHNVIDAIGDQYKTEVRTFKAVRDCIDELFRAVKKIVNNLNGTTVLITSDHGFLYNREPLEEKDKIQVIRDKGKILDRNRRMVIVKDEIELDGTKEVNLDYILEDPGTVRAYVPNGDIRFSIEGGGSRFVHGGMSLQEIVVPLIHFHSIRKDSAKSVTPSRPVKVELYSSARKITNNKFNLNFFQVEKISGKLKPVTLKLAFWDMDTEEMISDEKVLIADSTSEDVKVRQHKIPFVLKGKDFKKDKEYYLIMVNDETGGEIGRIPFTISIAIRNDFDDF